MIYQPQVDEWKDYAVLDWRSAFSLTPPGGKPVIGIAVMRGETSANPERDLVVITGLTVKRLDFPSLDEAGAASMEELTRTLVPPTVGISLRRLIACVPKPESVPSAPLRNDPPNIFVSNRPAILLFIEGKPELAPIKDTSIDFVVNTTWPLFLDKTKAAYYLLIGQEWLTAADLQGPWSPAAKLPADMVKVAADAEWATLKGVIPPPAVAKRVSPQVFYSSTPSEVILFDGQPVYAAIPGTQLSYATNTSSDVFMHSPTKQYYILTSGRWFRSNTLKGPWSFATAELPSDFARIPSKSPAGRVLESVPGTEESKDAVLLAQIPTTFEVDPAAAAAQAKVEYSGEPTFAPIENTSLSYATNTPDKVIKVGEEYYLCLQGIWFLSSTAQGPWTTANSVPQAIYSIPPSSPVYNVTYVTQTTSSSGTVTASHTSGYMGVFVVGMAVGAVVAHGSGYYYPPYMYYPPFGYPIYHPYPMTYGYVHHYHYGPYGAAHTVYGPYGAATRAAGYNPYTGTMARGVSVATPYGRAGVGQAYNPYTGTVARGASVATPYGSRTVAQAYNPYTGRYAATAQGSSPGAQWGSSVVTKGNQGALTQHYSNSQGTVGSIRTSSGGRAVAASGSGGSSGIIGRTSSGDMYAGKDGNAYKNTGNGWQKYENGSWNSINKPTHSNVQAQSGRYGGTGGGAHPQQLNQEMQNRQRGASHSQRYQQARGGGSARSFRGSRRR